MLNPIIIFVGHGTPMPWTILRNAALLAVLTLLVMAPFGSASARASEPARIESSCWAAASLAQPVAGLAAAQPRWRCDDRSHSIAAGRVLLRFDIGAGDAPPRYLFARRAALAAVHVLAIDADGAVRRTSTSARALLNARDGGYFKLPLPAIAPQTRQIIVAFDRPSHEMTIERAYLAAAEPDAGPLSTRSLLLLAGLCGMLLMPLIFNAAFYRILREPFVLWHSALTVSLMLTILVSSDLSAALLDLPVMTLSWMTTLVFGLSVASGAMFTYSFVEPGLMHPRLRRALPYCAAAAVALSAFHAAFPFVARPIQSPAYTAAFAPILALFIWSMIDALRRGSRAAIYQAIGWAPMVVVGLIRLVTGLSPSLVSHDAMLLFYFGCVFEVLSTAMGVADRFMTLKDQRDRARTEADLLDRLAKCDPLTGLSNRRALEEHYPEARARGFGALAVLDLDHFKAINDAHGHGVGDAVLKAAARALQPDADVQAFRLGGEEFVLLLRGDDSYEQAERRRQAIPAIVAQAVPGLSRPVTASMGVAGLSRHGAVEGGFSLSFERADKLLYDAKLAGRNRALFETPEAPRAASALHTAAA